MITLRLSTFSDNPSEFSKFNIVQGEKLTSAIDRALEKIPLDRPKEEVFQVLVNGIKIDSPVWKTLDLNETDSVLICPLLHGENEANFLRVVAILVVSAYAPGLAGGLGFGTFGTFVTQAFITVAGAALIYALIPPPTADPLGFGGQGTTSEDSQMYTISGQGNAVRKFASVPKVYGQHRMFPAVAANPYTEIAKDPETNELVSYLYCIYDFGHGPLLVNDLRIGDSPLLDGTSFRDVLHRFVDPNRPVANEGAWDEGLNSTFEIYKGDNEVDAVSTTLDGNSADFDPIETYETTKTTALNTDGVAQEIILNFVCPQGLFCYSSTGVIADRKITLEVKFRKVGTTEWRNFNDPTYVRLWEAAGGDPDYNDVDFPPAPLDINLTTLQSTRYSVIINYGIGFYGFMQENVTFDYDQEYGILAGATTYLGLSGVLVGSEIYYSGKYVGKVISSTVAGSYRIYTLDAPVKENIVIYRARIRANKVANVYTYSVLSTTPVYSGKWVRRYNSSSRGTIKAQSTSPVYATFRFTPIETGQFEVRVTRISTTSVYDTQTQDSLTFATLTTRLDSFPIVTDKRHTFLELRIRATNQLNGNIQNLSGLVTSVLDVWNGSAWVKQATKNPAWIYADLLSGQVNKRALPKSRLHTTSLLEWANFCDQVPTPPTGETFSQPRFQCNFILDYSSTVQQAIAQVTSAAQASFNIIDGKYGVLIDKLKTVPVQVFTPRNSRNFSATKVFAPRPHALKIGYINPANDWQLAERIVYDDGQNATTATVFEEMTSFGVTNPEQAWRFGRFMIAQNKLRQEIITIEVDFEHLVCTRGDYVKITQDVMLVGGSPARVKTVVDANTIEIDDSIETGMGSYGYLFRKADGQILTSTLTVINAYTFDLDGDMPEVGDLIVIGLVSNLTYDCLVKSISPNSDMSATLTLVEKADGVYTAESDDTISAYDPAISPTVNSDFTPPSEVVDLTVTDNFWECNGGQYQYYVELDWDAPTGAAYETFEIYANDGTGYDIVDRTRASIYKYIVDPSRLNVEHTFKVLAVSAAGQRLDLGLVGEVAATPVTKTTRPSSVTKISSDITGEVLQLFWEKIADCDCDRYRIRYSPTLTGSWSSSIPLLEVDKSTSLIATQARTGTYLIKAVDFNGNESDDAAVLITTIPELFNLNIIEVINDFPALAGSKDQVETDGTSLTIQPSVIGTPDTQQYYSEGYYYYEDLLDLTEIYTVRLQSLIEAEGFTLNDLMSNWTTLADVDYMSSAGSAQWDVRAEYRTTNNLNVIADWTPMSDVVLMSSGDADQWSIWRDFVIGDATGRIFQFRLRLISNQTSVTPRVFDGEIRADMPDRIESYENLAVPDTGLAVTYSPAFKGPTPSPSVQVSLQDGQSGDYWVFTAKTVTGFTIEFYDNSDTQVARSADFQIKGYGRKNANII
jgi:hypothetical protein